MNDKQKAQQFALMVGVVLGWVVGICMANFGWVIGSAVQRGGSDNVFSVILFIIIIAGVFGLINYAYNTPEK